MLITFENKLALQNIICNNCILKPNESINIDIRDDEEITVGVFQKSKVKMSLLNLWLGSLNVDNIYTCIECDAIFALPRNRQFNKITFRENKIHLDNNVFYRAVSVYINDDAYNDNVTYCIKDCKKIKRKFNFVMFFIASAFPLLVLGAAEMLRKPNAELGICLAILFFIAFVPAMRQIKKFNKIWSDENAKIYLLKPLSERTPKDIYENFITEMVSENGSSHKIGILKIVKKLFFD